MSNTRRLLHTVLWSSRKCLCVCVCVCTCEYVGVCVCVCVCVWRILTSTDVNYTDRCSQSNRFNWRLPTYVDVWWRMHTSSCVIIHQVWWRMLTCPEVWWRMLTYADVCWRMLTYVVVCRCSIWCISWPISLCMLTYADVRWRMLSYAGAASGVPDDLLPRKLRDHTRGATACVNIRQRMYTWRDKRMLSVLSAYVSIRQHTSTYVSVCIPEETRGCWQYFQHTSVYVSMRQHTSAYVYLNRQEDVGSTFSIRMLTNADVCWRMSRCDAIQTTCISLCRLIYAYVRTLRENYFYNVYFTKDCLEYHFGD
jgi:hypothetical protein